MSKNIATWAERQPETSRQLGTAMSQVPYMEQEISDLRAYIAELEARTPAEPCGHEPYDDCGKEVCDYTPAAPVVAASVEKLLEDHAHAVIAAHEHGETSGYYVDLCAAKSAIVAAVGAPVVAEGLTKNDIEALAACYEYYEKDDVGPSLRLRALLAAYAALMTYQIEITD